MFISSILISFRIASESPKQFIAKTPTYSRSEGESGHLGRQDLRYSRPIFHIVHDSIGRRTYPAWFGGASRAFHSAAPLVTWLFPVRHSVQRVFAATANRVN